MLTFKELKSLGFTILEVISNVQEVGTILMDDYEDVVSSLELYSYDSEQSETLYDRGVTSYDVFYEQRRILHGISHEGLIDFISSGEYEEYIDVEEKEYEVEVEISLKEVVIIKAKSELEAKEIFLNDSEHYSGLLKSQSKDEYYNGVVDVSVVECDY